MARRTALLPLHFCFSPLSLIDDRHPQFSERVARGVHPPEYPVPLPKPIHPGAYKISLQISLITSIGGAIFGFLLAYAAIRGGLPVFMRASLLTFCGVASNFAGVRWPLLLLHC